VSALRTTLLSKPVKSSKPATPVLTRRYHMHSGGAFYIVVSILLGVGSINSQNNLLFIVFGVALGAMLVSGIVSGAMMVNLEIERRPIGPAQVGSNARFSYRLRNKRKRVPAMAIDIIEADRPRRKLRKRVRVRPIAESFVDVAPAGASVDIGAVLPCERRGVFRFDPITISTTFPFGIVLKSVTVTAPDELLVLPRVVELPPSLLLSGGGRGRTETERHDRRGLGLEFYAIRDYQPGDPMRRIAWKQSARAGGLRTRELASPVAATIMIELALNHEEQPSGRDRERKGKEVNSEGERAITLAASLATLASRLNISVGLRVPQLGVDIEPSQNYGRTSAILEALARIELADDRLKDLPRAHTAPDNARVIRVQPKGFAASPSPGTQVLSSDLLDRMQPDSASGRGGA